jgi:hypothetical protein
VVVLLSGAPLQAQNAADQSLKAADATTLHVAFMYFDDGVKTFVEMARLKGAVLDKLRAGGLTAREIAQGSLPRDVLVNKGYLYVQVDVVNDAAFQVSASYVRVAGIRWGAASDAQSETLARVWHKAGFGRKSTMGYMHDAVAGSLDLVMAEFLRSYLSANLR